MQIEVFRSHVYCLHGKMIEISARCKIKESRNVCSTVHRHKLGTEQMEPNSEILPSSPVSPVKTRNSHVWVLRTLCVSEASLEDQRSSLAARSSVGDKNLLACLTGLRRHDHPKPLSH